MSDESFVSKKLIDIINEKKEYINKVQNDFAKKKMQEEVLFLERSVLPLVLSQTTILYWEVMKHVTTKMRQAAELKCDSVLCFIPLHNRMPDPYVIGIDNPKAQTVGDVNVDCLEITVDRIGIDKKTCTPINLPLYGI